MTWQPVPNNSRWEYEDSPPDPGANSPYRDLWLKQSGGVRTWHGYSIYTMTRRVGTTPETYDEINKSYWG